MLVRIVLAVCVVLGMGCDSVAGPSLRDREPTIVGPIVGRDVPTSISEDRPTLHVKEQEDAECGIIFVIAPETEVVRSAGKGSLDPADVDDLRPGDTVAVWTTGPLLLSCPAQAGAEAIEILSM